MDLVLNNIGKRYRFDWIFRQVNYHFKEGRKYAILGPNGSGKSTLMKVLSGHLTPSKGNIEFQKNGSKILVDRIYRSVSYAAPYIDVIEELTLEEAINFHIQFKPMLNNLSTADIIALLNFSGSKKKEIRFFSSGMKQRLRLALSICSDTELLLLDEPTTNLDQQGFDWYQELITTYAGDRLVIVASNVEMDYHFCEERLNIMDFKKKKEKE
ncbi:MAG: ABC-type multidrug transport system ATPase subunit [Saprospiraceae bacterium]|jgi:ABC-type multidrug transport system ATPase subunit